MRAFGGDTGCNRDIDVQGNPCLVHMASAGPVDDFPTLGSTACITWPSGNRRAGVHCRTANSAPIRVCGHGLLCCAALWLDRWRAGGALLSDGLTVACESRGGETWLAMPAAPLERCAVPDWAGQVLGITPIRCARAGQADDYLVLELAKDTDLTRVAAPDATLESLTRRALIVTCRVSQTAAVCGEDIQFRYFAPQYGVAEDTATGSAMRVLNGYWLTTGAQSVLRALQRSAAGGLLLGRLQGDRSWVGGRVHSLGTGAQA